MPKKILIIEDHATDAAISKEVLEKEGFEVEVVSSGEEGAKKALEIKPDLVLLDLVLPGIDGFEVCRRIKKEAALHRTIVIILSVKDDIDDISRAFHAGADDYIIKTPLPEFLVRKLKLYLRT